jgi:hypothetical protein
MPICRLFNDLFLKSTSCSKTLDCKLLLREKILGDEINRILGGCCELLHDQNELMSFWAGKAVILSGIKFTPHLVRREKKAVKK